ELPEEHVISEGAILGSIVIRPWQAGRLDGIVRELTLHTGLFPTGENAGARRLGEYGGNLCRGYGCGRVSRIHDNGPWTAPRVLVEEGVRDTDGERRRFNDVRVGDAARVNRTDGSKR